MKYRILSLLLLCSAFMYAQPGDEEDVEYFTDATVKHSRFSAAILVNPNFTDRRLINDETPEGSGYDLFDEKANGSFQLNYNLEVYYAIRSGFHIGIGFGRSGANYSVDRVSYYDNRPNNDTALAKLDVSIGMFTVPIKLNFNTRVNDLWDLEVVPSVSLNFFDKYDQTITPIGESAINSDLSGDTRLLSYTVSLSLGGTYYLSESWGLVIRGNGRYMLNPIIDKTNFPRETIYSFGADIGLRYKF